MIFLSVLEFEPVFSTQIPHIKQVPSTRIIAAARPVFHSGEDVPSVGAERNSHVKRYMDEYIALSVPNRKDRCEYCENFSAVVCFFNIVPELLIFKRKSKQSRST
jgi:hypothetical protein